MKKAWPYILFIAIAAATAIAIRRLKIFNITDSLPTNGQYGTRDLSQVKYIVLHHSASEGQNPYDYARYHTQEDGHGWPGIGYHFVIQPDGTSYQTNHLETISYHTKGNNTAAIGICLSGNLSNKPPTRAQEDSLKRVIKHVRQKLPGSASVHGHGEFVNTTCPGSLDVDKFR